MIATTALNAEEPTNINSHSISQLITTHPRDRLFVHPLTWTARHLSLLCCRFFDDGVITIAPLPPTPTTPPATLPSPPNSVPADDDDAGELQRYLADINSDASAARRLAKCTNSTTRGQAISQLLREPKYYRDKVHFYFARRAVAQLPCYLFSHASQSPSQPPPLAQLAYLDLSEIAHHRKTKLAGPAPPLGARCRFNTPSFRRVQKQLRLLTPEDPREDPYIAALLIALAQEQRLYSEGDGNDNNEKNFTDATSAATPSQMLLVTRPGGIKWLYIYTSKVSLDFLDGLDRPSRPPPADAPSRLGMGIYRRRLAFKPYKTLTRRLAAVVRDAGSLGHLVPEI
ncbi:hypothetical protein B0H63DRAFT_222140 [Podospora didyma]|uniref:Uncharacterized protein n=1 Tax=Podospora didyma TaxID=330526 RepID=A0AAE0KJ97_9PEZI|nr:hypothetical protein B0H63DRAFT_222140 [Podospora didyma]